MRRDRPIVDDPVGSAGDSKGMRANLGHVFVERRSPVSECRIDIRSYRNDPLRGLVDQASKKSRCVACGRRLDFGINMFRDLFYSEKDLINQVKDAVRIMEDDVMGRDLKNIGSPQGLGCRRRTVRGRANPAEPPTLQTAIQR